MLSANLISVKFPFLGRLVKAGHFSGRRWTRQSNKKWPRLLHRNKR